MKYQLPKNIKHYKFFCTDALVRVNYGDCKKHCHSDYRHCWEQHLRQDLFCDCAIENERNAERYIKCPICGKPCTGMAFNKYLCNDCGHVEHYDAEVQKGIMGEDYLEIDGLELDETVMNVL